MSIKDTIKTIYNNDNSEGLYSYLIPFVIIFAVSIFTFIYLIKINLRGSALNWETTKCIPKYMFVSGFIQTEDDEGVLEGTYTNFKQCVKRFASKHKK